MSTITPPPATLELKTMDGTAHTLKMSFNHLNMIAAHVAGADGAAVITASAEGRDRIVAIMFGARDESGRFTPANPDEIDLDPDAAGELFDWATEHLTDFFVKRLAKTRQMLQSIVPAVKELNGPQ